MLGWIMLYINDCILPSFMVQFGQPGTFLYAFLFLPKMFWVSQNNFGLRGWLLCTKLPLTVWFIAAMNDECKTWSPLLYEYFFMSLDSLNFLLKGSFISTFWFISLILIFICVFSLHVFRGPISLEWQQRLPNLVRRLEEALFKEATSKVYIVIGSHFVNPLLEGLLSIQLNIFWILRLVILLLDKCSAWVRIQISIYADLLLSLKLSVQFYTCGSKSVSPELLLNWSLCHSFELCYQEEYMNLSTLECRLTLLMKRFQHNHN